MKLIALTALTMIAFAGNSLLNRAGLASEQIGPAGFVMVRTVSGALMLWALLFVRAGALPKPQKIDITAVAALVVYLLGFSFAYVTLDAGLGALLLFGIVQVTMFTGAVISKEELPRARWFGMAVALFGLAVLVWPQGAAPRNIMAMVLMGVAAVGWGVYSLAGRGVRAPIVQTAWNFIYATPFVLGVGVFYVWQEGATVYGVVLAVIAGALTSGLGYSIWYRLLPQLGASTGALVQLSVPVIAMGAGAMVLGEMISVKAALASCLVLSGIGVGLLVRK